MSDYHNATHRAVGPDLACRVCELLDAIGSMPHAEQEAVLDRLLELYRNPTVIVLPGTSVRVEACDRPCCRRSP